MINADVSIRRVLIVCPASIKINWSRELTRWLVRPMTVAVVDAKTKQTDKDYTDCLVVNYDILVRLPWLADIAWDMVVLDEGQQIKSFAAQRTKAAHKLHGRRKLIMTGTPIMNRPEELYSLLHWLDPVAWPSFNSYARRYCAAWDAPWGWDTSGASHLEELNQILRGTLMVRRTKSEVLEELPQKRRQLVELPANGATRVIQRELAAWETHEALQAELHTLLLDPRENDEDYREQVESLRAGVRVAFEDMARLRHETAIAKIPQVIDHIRGCLENDGKYVAFCWHHDTIDAIMAAFPDISVRLDGRMNITDRQKSVDRFQNCEAVRLFVGNIQAAGVGITLTASSHAIFAELDWVPANISQAEDRLHRIGQRESVLIQHLVLEGSLDCRMAKTIIEKQDIINQAID